MRDELEDFSFATAGWVLLILALCLLAVTLKILF